MSCAAPHFQTGVKVGWSGYGELAFEPDGEVEVVRRCLTLLRNESYGREGVSEAFERGEGWVVGKVLWN